MNIPTLIQETLKSFWFLHAEMAPWLLLGLFVAGALGYAMKASWWAKHLGQQNFASHLKAVLVGIPLPLCSCSVIPTGIGLYRRGASRSAALSFLTATPQTGVDSIMLTGGVLGWPLALVKVFAALVMGLVTGTLLGFSKDEKRLQLDPDTPKDETRSLRRWWEQSSSELPAALAKPYLLGLLVSVVLTQILPKDGLALLAGSPLSEMGLALLISLPMYVCATSSIPFALLFLQQGLGYGAVLVFLMAGPASNIATMLVIAKEFGWRSFAVYFGVLIVGCFAIGYGMENILPRPEVTSLLETHEHTGPLSHLAGLVLLLLFIPHLIKRKHKATAVQTQSWNLSGLSCQGCVKKLTNHFQKNGVEVLNMSVERCELQDAAKYDIPALCAELGYKAERVQVATPDTGCSKGSCCH